MHSLCRFQLMACFCFVVSFLMNAGTGSSVSGTCGGWTVVSSPNG